jgi:hypothetical protein
MMEEANGTQYGYDLIIVGSGNGACGFLSHYLSTALDCVLTPQILVIEEGKDFFYTSDITHQNSWTKSYSEDDVFKLHRASTPEGVPIISGRACTMGGGGSINYTMIHESSDWLAAQLGQDASYWDQLKKELNTKFALPHPKLKRSPITQHIVDCAEQFGFQMNTDETHGIPNFRLGLTGLLHLFPTQFDQFGQRTHSGVSLVNWSDPRVTLKTECKVKQLNFVSLPSDAQCFGVETISTETGNQQCFVLNPKGGKLLLCAGAETPRLLMPHRQLLANPEIGQYVSDHVLLPLGIYLLDRKLDVTARDVYVPVFATTEWQPQAQGQATVCCFDFFTGNFQRLWYFISHLYLAFLLPNWLKSVAAQFPWVFLIIKNTIRLLIQGVNWLVTVWTGLQNLARFQPWAFESDWQLITAIIKFNPALEGCYDDDSSGITLEFFSKQGDTDFNQDQELVQQKITEQLMFLNSLGSKPPWPFRGSSRDTCKIVQDDPKTVSGIDF